MKKKILVVVAIFVLAGLSYVGFRAYKGKSEPKILSEKSEKNVTPGQPKTVTEDATATDSSSDAQDAQDAQLDAQYADLNSKCEAGEWVDLDTVSGDKKSFTGKFSVDVPFEDDNQTAGSTNTTNTANTDDAQDQYYLNGTQQVVSQKDDILGFFDTREVEISGVENQGKITPEKIRCTGKETDKDLINFRQEVMNYANDNFKTLAPQQGNWEIYDIAWPADDYIYVDFAAAESDSGDSQATTDDNVYSVLYQVSKENGQIKLTQQAFLKMSDSDNQDWDVISGTDKFQNKDDVDFYEYDDELGKWTK